MVTLQISVFALYSLQFSAKPPSIWFHFAFCHFVIFGMQMKIFNEIRSSSVVVPLLSAVLTESSLIVSNIFFCVLKMNEGLTSLERHEGEQLMTSFSFLSELSF